MRYHEVASIECRYCKTRRYYLLKDFRTLFGNIEVDDVLYQQHWRCVNCRKSETLSIDLVSSSAADRQKMMIRRIDRIDYVRRVIWRDETG